MSKSNQKAKSKENKKENLEISNELIESVNENIIENPQSEEQLLIPENKQEVENVLELKIDDLLNNEIEERKNNSGITYFNKNGGRVFKILNSKKGFKIEFNFPVTNTEGLITFTEIEASEKHMGTCRWIYIGNDINKARNLIKECISNYIPKTKKVKETKKEKVKIENKESKNESKKEFSNEPIVVSKNISKKDKDLLEKIGREIQESEEF